MKKLLCIIVMSVLSNHLSYAMEKEADHAFVCECPGCIRVGPFNMNALVANLTLLHEQHGAQRQPVLSQQQCVPHTVITPPTDGAALALVARKKKQTPAPLGAAYFAAIGKLSNHPTTPILALPAPSSDKSTNDDDEWCIIEKEQKENE